MVTYTIQPLNDHAVTATGSTTPRPFDDRFADVMNVKDFGAVSDGVTDDSAAIQAAVDALRSRVAAVNGWDTGAMLFFPHGAYHVLTSIDMTAIRALGVSVIGDGAVIHGHCVGKPVIDALYSRYIRWCGLTIIGDATDTPQYGIQIGRKDNSNPADFHIMDNVTIAGSFSGACLYNLGSETSHFNHCKLYNNLAIAGAYCLIMDGANNFSAASDYVTVTATPGTAASFNENIFVGCDFRRQTTGKAIVYSGSPARHQFYGCYGVSVDDWVIYFFKLSAINQMTLDLHAETTGSLGYLLIDNVNPSGVVILQGLRIRDHNPQGSVAVIDTTGATRQVLIDGCDLEFAGVPTAVPLFGSTSGSSNNILVSGDIRWEDSDALTLTNCRFTGRIFTESSTTIAHTLGSYQVVRRPASADTRALTVKGEFRVAGTRDAATEANYVALTGSASAAGIVEITAGGSDTDLDVRMTPKGTGTVRFGTHAALSGETVSGYITVKDAAGNSRKLAVVS